MNPRAYVDFNEVPSADEVLLAQGDSKLHSAGSSIEFREGKAVAVYVDDLNDNGLPDRLVADGIAILSRHREWTSAATWILKIDSRGIRHEPEESPQ